MSLSRKRWRLIAGGASALVFIVLLAIRLDIFHSASSVVDSGSVSQSLGNSPRESWMKILQAGRHIGYSHRKLEQTELGYRLDESVFMRINTMGVAQGISISTISDLNPDLSISSFDFKLKSSLFNFSVSGAVKDGNLAVEYGTPGTAKKMNIALKEIPHLAGSIMNTAWSSGLKPGQSRKFQIFDPSSMGQRPVVVSVLDDEEIIFMGEKRKFRKVSVDYMGARQYAWIDRNGEIVREEGMLGISMEKSTKKEATDGISSSSADLTEMASLPSAISIPDPAALKVLSVKLANADAKTFFLDGDRQQLKGGILTINKEELPQTRIQTMRIPGDISVYLRATPFIQSDDALIRAKAREISSYDDPRRLRAAKIVTWVYRNIEKRPVLSVPNALETLINHVGDCNEHAVLVAALARASGIPAQVEAGLVYQRGRFYYHAWNVLYVGGIWVTADAVLNQIPADVTHIRFVRGEADSQLDLVGLIGQVKMEVLSAK